MERKNAVLVVEDENVMFNELEKMGSPLAPVQTHYTEAEETLSRVSPHAVIFNLDHQKHEVIKILNTFHKTHPETRWMITGNGLSKEDLVEFMRLGVSDYLEQPLSDTDKQYLMEKLKDCRRPVHTENSPTNNHRIISFFSGKGGVGLSVSAANLAMHLAKSNLERVLLVDFVLQHGNIAELVDVIPSYTIFDLMENLERVDVKLLDHSLLKHPSGAFVLPCPKQPEDSEFFTAKDTATMLKTLKESFNFTLVDVGHELNASSIACMDMSDMIFLMTTPDLPSLCNMKTALDTFKKLGYKKEKIKVLLNRKGMKGEIESDLIAKNLGTSIDYHIPDEPVLVMNAVNQGVPFHQIAKNAEIVKVFEKLADEIASTAKKGN